MEQIKINNDINNLNILANVASNELNKIKYLKEQKRLFNLIFQNIDDIDLYFEKELIDEIKYHLANYCNFPNTILQKRSYKQIIYLIKLFHSKRLKRKSINPKYLEDLDYEVYSIVPKQFDVHVLFRCLKNKCRYSICGSKRYLSLTKVKYYLEKHNEKHKNNIKNINNSLDINQEFEIISKNPKIELGQVNMIYDKSSID
jgi:hypothetical protein